METSFNQLTTINLALSMLRQRESKLNQITTHLEHKSMSVKLDYLWSVSEETMDQLS